ncbi:COX aromatic rich motif-containing protein [Labrys sp. KB_33_2]|uniref:ubiquinol oxidase subunit II n=1 Tax=Labrys sp. KB_33_2 TaxID=3237479 RepID=UPI003F8EA8B7
MRRWNAIVCVPLLLSACSREQMPILNPNGEIARTHYETLVIATAIMLFIIVPLILATLVVAWRYRETGQAPDYDPKYTSSGPLRAIVLWVPLLTVATLGAITWYSTYRTDPYKPLPGSQPPLEIQAIGLDYKWLFIYPEAGVAVVNDFVVPVDRPVTLRLTSDPMMTSIFVPGLMSQIYAMPGMETRTNFLATDVREMMGANANYNGEGFANQRFKARILSETDFNKWVSETKAANKPLDKARYDALSARDEDSAAYPVTTYSSVQADLFASIIRKFRSTHSLSQLSAKAAEGTNGHEGH